MRYQSRWPSPILLVVLFFFRLAASPPLFSQVLVVEPGCGKAGDTVRVTGSGWAEPNPVCEYRFYFDGAEFIGRQPDGLFGPPDRSGAIPAGTPAGEHTVKVELRLTSDGSLLQCRQTKIKVVDTIKDPWQGGISTLGGDSIDIKFDPKDVCDVSPCTNLVYIQTRKLTGQQADGTTRRVTYVEQGCWDNAAKIDADFTAAGVSVDRIWGKTVPYYGIPGGAASPGFSGRSSTPMDKITSMSDAPARPDSCYPVNAADPSKNIVKLQLDFEANVFCAAGQDQGKYFGKITWRWERMKGKMTNGLPDPTGTVTSDSPSRDQPSQEFLAAVDLWDANHSSWSKPTPLPPTLGGEACN